MTVNQFARAAIRNTMQRECMTVYRAEHDPRIAAWLVWSMRNTSQAKEDFKTFNRARRTLQRAGLKHI